MRLNKWIKSKVFYMRLEPQCIVRYWSFIKIRTWSVSIILHKIVWRDLRIKERGTPVIRMWRRWFLSPQRGSHSPSSGGENQVMYCKSTHSFDVCRKEICWVWVRIIATDFNFFRRKRCRKESAIWWLCEKEWRWYEFYTKLYKWVLESLYTIKMKMFR